MQAGLFRAVGSFFTVGGSWLKMSATMVGRQRKFFKKYWLKRPKANPSKMKTGPEYKWFKISYLQFLFFENITSGIQHFYISPDVPIDTTRRSNWHHQIFFLDFRFSSRKSQSQQKLVKKITHFTIQFRSTILRTATHLTLKIVSSRNTAKSLSDFANFPADMFLFGVRKNICTAPFLDAQ